MDFSKLIDWFKLKSRYLVSIVIVSSVLLFLPQEWLTRLGLHETVSSYRGWIGGAFLLSGVLLITNLAAYLIEPLQGSINDWRRLLVYSKYLKDLTPEEKSVLKRYLDNNTQTQLLNIKDGVAQGLVAKKILYRSSNLGYMEGAFAYNLQPWAWHYLKKHPELLSD